MFSAVLEITSHWKKNGFPIVGTYFISGYVNNLIGIYLHFFVDQIHGKGLHDITDITKIFIT